MNAAAPVFVIQKHDASSLHHDDEGADARRRPVSTQPESVVSGRTIEKVEAEESG